MLGPGSVHGVAASWSTALPTSAMAVLSLGVRGSEPCDVRRGLWTRWGWAWRGEVQGQVA